VYTPSGILIQFQEEVPHLEEATRLSTQAVFVNVNSLMTGLELVKNTTRSIHSLKNVSEEKFLPVMEDFISRSEKQILALSKMATSVEVGIRDTLSYFGEVGKEAMKPDDFFALIFTFSSDLQKATLELPEEEAAHKSRHGITATGGSDEGSVISPLPHIQTQKHLKISTQTNKSIRVNSMIRGQFDQTLRSVKEGHRTHRNRLSKIFLDS